MRETPQIKIFSFQKQKHQYLIHLVNQKKLFMGTVVNQTCHLINKGSLEMISIRCLVMHRVSLQNDQFVSGPSARQYFPYLEYKKLLERKTR